MIISPEEKTMKEKNMPYSIQTTQHSHQLILYITIKTDIHKVIQLLSNSEIKSNQSTTHCKCNYTSDEIGSTSASCLQNKEC